jgi:hypothetical protein
MENKLISAEKVSQNGYFDAAEGCRMMMLKCILKKQTVKIVTLIQVFEKSV